MNKPDTDAALELLDKLKEAANSMYKAASHILDAIGDAEGNLLGDDVDPAADRSALIASELAAVESMVNQAEDAVFDSRDLLAD
jgi:hypothetical protein